MNEAEQAGIERFVRGTLGCGCPDEVFRSVSVERLPGLASRPPVLQLLVGSRLVIHVVAPPPAGGQGNGWLEQLAAQGRSIRDRHGYNRFRLVLATAAPGPQRGELEARFARAVTGDERAHLHWVPPDLLPPGLAPGAAADQVPPAPGRTVAK